MFGRAAQPHEGSRAGHGCGARRSVPKLAITIDPEVHGKILAALDREAVSLSAVREASIIVASDRDDIEQLAAASSHEVVVIAV